MDDGAGLDHWLEISMQMMKRRSDEFLAWMMHRPQVTHRALIHRKLMMKAVQV